MIFYNLVLDLKTLALETQSLKKKKKRMCLVRWISPSLSLSYGGPFSHPQFCGCLLDLGVLTQGAFHPQPGMTPRRKWYKHISVLMRTKCNTQTTEINPSSFSSSKLLTMELENLENPGGSDPCPPWAGAPALPLETHRLKLCCQLHWLWLHPCGWTESDQHGNRWRSKREEKKPRALRVMIIIFETENWARKIF